MIIHAFGDIVLYDDAYFIYLAHSSDDEIHYALKILNDRDTKYLKEMIDRGRFQESDLVLVFVILKTKEFDGQMCNFQNSDKPEYFGRFLKQTKHRLCKDDIKKLKERIRTKATIGKLREVLEEQELLS